MPFVLKKYKSVIGKKIQIFLLEDANLPLAKAQRLLAKNRVFNDQDKALKNGDIVSGEFIQVAVFAGSTRGLKPIFEVEGFAVFDKPSGLMVHPTRKTTKYCLLDEIRYQFGEDADLVHRIDAETSGLVLVAKNKQVNTILKIMFENKEYKKEYLAVVKGQVKEDITIDKPIAKANSKITIKMTCENNNGKLSTTHIQPLKFNEKDNTTLVKATPITGRQHQIRVHLDAIGHSILGDPIYGVSEQVADKYLNKALTKDGRVKVTGAERLMLHANRLAFIYKNQEYDITSKFSKFYE